MSKSRGAAPTRGLRAPTMTPKPPALDPLRVAAEIVAALADAVVVTGLDRKVLTANRSAAELFGRRSESTRLNSSHVRISYAVFCLKKKKSMPVQRLPFRRV